MPIRRTDPTAEDRKWMRRAVDLAGQCVTEPGRNDESPKVGAVAVGADGGFLGESYRGAIRPGDHAEYCLINQIGDGLGRLAGATVYTTLEPCTYRHSPKIPCAQRLIREGVAVVYIGMLDPDPRVRELGWKALGQAGIERRDFTADLREEVLELNAPFVEGFRTARGPTGTIRFDYMQNAGRMQIDNGNGVLFETTWSLAGSGSIHAVGPVGSLALAKTAEAVDEIDDPGAYEFAGHSKHARQGQIVIFRNQYGYALVRIETVLAGPDYGDSHTEAVVSYELRLTN